MTTEPTTPVPSRDVELILRGHPYRAIIRMAWPATASMLLHTLFAVVDMIWVGRLGAEPIAAVISAAFVVWILFSLTSILTTGVVAMISRYLGAGDTDRARAIAEESWRFGLILGVVIAAVGVGFREPIIGVMRLDPEVTRIGAAYLGVYFSAALFLLVDEWGSAVFRASGDTRTPLLVISSALILNMVLDPLLIFGIGPFPRWEATGAAVASVIAHLIAAILFVIIIRRNRLPFPLHLRLIGPMNWRRIGRMVSIGVPISVSGVVFCVVYLFVNRITAGFGTEAVAALGIGNRIESINYLVSFGFATATAALVGQNLGAKNSERAAELVNKTIKLVSVFTGITAILFLVFPEVLIRFFVDDPNVVAAGKSYVRILALSQILMGWEIVLEGAFSGAGDTMPPMLVSIPGSIARIPLA
ncbi:MAG TPA: MATE family efflux transporter, partial [Acidobacteriota bacterium]|nr:MATE family efflux transporter [Acidobacteriota bacterium]